MLKTLPLKFFIKLLFKIMNDLKKGPGRPRKAPLTSSQFRGDKDYQKKVKTEDEVLYHPQYNANDDDEDGNSDYEPYDDDGKWASSGSSKLFSTSFSLTLF